MKLSVIWWMRKSSSYLYARRTLQFEVFLLNLLYQNSKWGSFNCFDCEVVRLRQITGVIYLRRLMREILGFWQWRRYGATQCSPITLECIVVRRMDKQQIRHATHKRALFSTGPEMETTCDETSMCREFECVTSWRTIGIVGLKVANAVYVKRTCA